MTACARTVTKPGVFVPIVDKCEAWIAAEYGMKGANVSPTGEHGARAGQPARPGERETTSIRVDVDRAGYRTIAVAGLLDRAAVAAVRAATEQAQEQSERVVLDLIGVSSVEGDSLGELARALRDLGVDLDVVSSPVAGNHVDPEPH